MPQPEDERVTAARKAIREAGGLVTTADIAREWGVTHQAVEKRVRAGAFPRPVKVAGRVKLFLRAQVEHLRR